MDIYQSILLGITQGITEFLPISSSGHLNLLQHFFGFTPSLSLDIFLNTATLFSVIFFFKNQIKYFFDNLKYVVIGTIPAIIAGLFFKDIIESSFSSVKFMPYEFLITSILLFATKFIKIKSNKLNYKNSIIIGLMQAVAILPAVSRSGATIATALLLGLAPLESFNFSFCLFIVASIGAIILDYKILLTTSFFNLTSILTFIITTITGVVALNFLQKIMQKNSFWYFGIYTLILAIGLLFVL